MRKILAKLCPWNPSLFRSMRRRAAHHAQPPREAQRLQLRTCTRACAAAMTRAESESAVRCVLITGAGRGFCAGADLTQRDMKSDAPIDLGAGLDAWYNPLVKRMRALPKPDRLRGERRGGGRRRELRARLRHRASPRARRPSSRPSSKIGLVPDCGGTYFLPRLAGMQRAMALAMTGDRALGRGRRALRPDLEMRRRRAARAGDRALHAGAGERADAVAGPGSRRPSTTRAGNSLAAQLDLERDLQREVGKGSDYREGVTAFLEKRSPNFTGR